MISRFKNALLNAVSSPVLDTSNASSVVSGRGGGSASTSTTTSSSSAVPHSYSTPHLNGNSETSLTNKNARLQQSSHHHGTSDYNAGANGFQERVKRYEYGRPHFLQLNSPDEIAVTADHIVRPIIVPRDLTHLPWETGYAETINSGKSKVNEDQARMHAGFVKVEIEDGESEIKEVKIPYYYFGVFDGHAGPGAAVAAAARLHLIIEDKLTEVGNHLCQEGQLCDFSLKNKGKGVMWFPHTNITKDSLIVGALESAFYEMDELIREENLKYDGVNGGCTAVVCLFILGKVFIANAGDSRSILCYRDLEPVPLSNDFTPESERARIRLLAAQNPHLLGMDFTSNEYLRRPVKRDLGSKILYRAAHMTGWAYKTATVEDLKFPVVFGHGKRSRVLATIGVTRGFGDHELYAHSTAIKIKPFLTSQPEVKILDLVEDSLLEDAVVVMGTDGLWDVTANQTVSRIVFNTLEQFPQVDTARYKYRYVSAAQDLVMHARGKFQERNWKMSDGSAATIDDISVFVIPLGPYYRDAVAQESLTSISLNSLPNSTTLVNDNGSCSADSELQSGTVRTVNEVNANVLASNTSNNNGLSSSSFNNNHNTDSVLNGDADPSVELVSEAIDLEMDEPNH